MREDTEIKQIEHGKRYCSLFHNDFFKRGEKGGQVISSRWKTESWKGIGWQKNVSDRKVSNNKTWRSRYLEGKRILDKKNIKLFFFSNADGQNKSKIENTNRHSKALSW